MEFKGKTMIEFIKKMFGNNKEEALKALSLPEPTVTPKMPKVEKPKKTPKEIATENKEPWVAVMDTHVNKDNIRNGFFELDWNEYFVLQLRSNGYQGETEEAVVDLWFQDLCRNIGSESEINMDRRGAGYVNRALRDDGRTEIS
jgi:adenylate cyclase class IV